MNSIGIIVFSPHHRHRKQANLGEKLTFSAKMFNFFIFAAPALF